jgi:2-keto-4-pentenoate hydratase/2-oxohepta-3-ene-1,7-dioic acid hydratase in catechol pathway
MRLCRFLLDELTLVGLYLDDSVIAIDQAAEVAADVAGLDLMIGASDDLLDYLPPDGPVYDSIRALWDWIEGMPGEDRAELTLPADNVQLLVPIAHPPKLLLLAGNYPKHVEERGGSATERADTFPYVFMKPASTTLTNPGDPIVIPAVSPDHIDWECELGVVIGRRGRNIPESEALEYVAGYTVVNDISDRQFRPNSERKPRPRDEHFDWLHGKWHDTFCPMGPCLLAAGPGFDPQAARLRLAVNGEVKQDATTGQMIFSVPAIIAFLSSFMTLEPGDVIATGTPSGVGSARGEYLEPGDLVEATIEGIGTLANPVEAERFGP